MGTVWRWLCVITCAAVLYTGQAQAVDGTITLVEPATTGQGETVLLTITGESLPQGTLVLEFFPQQIALLDILAASETEIQALVKVAHTAPPGKYNVMVYNQRGEEAFGDGLLEVGASVITPVFKNYDPKTIADASSGFALLLTGEYITEASVSHLSVNWEQDGKKINSLSSSFSLGGNRAVVCAVEGAPPPGLLRGRIYLDGTPIYLVDVAVEGGSALIIGHTPAQLNANDNLLKLKLLGSELTALAVRGLSVELASTALTAKAQQVVRLDSASCEAQFTGPLPAGEYSLTVVSAGSQVYASSVMLIAGEAVPEIQPEQPGTPEQDEPGTSEIQPNTPDESTASTPQTGTPLVTPNSGLRILEISPSVIDPSDKACRFTITTTGLDESLLGELAPELVIAGEAATLLLSGSSGIEMTCVFSPPADGWPAGIAGEFALRLPGADIASATVPVRVGEAPAAPSTTEAPAPSVVEEERPEPSGAWQATTAKIMPSGSSSKLVIGITPPGGDYELSQLEGSFTLLPDELGYADMFGNLALSGKLAISDTGDGKLTADCTGNFVSGSLMVTLRYGGGTAQLSMLTLGTALPKLKITAPDASGIEQDVVSGSWRPETLRWSLETAPFEVVDTRFITIGDAQGKAIDAVVSASGSTVHVDCPTDDLAAPDGLDGELRFSLPFEIVGETRFHVSPRTDSAMVNEETPVESPVEDEVKQTVSFVENTLHVCDEGLWVVLTSQGSSVDLSGWRDVTVETNQVLLQSNLEKFSPEVQSAPSATSLGQGVFRLLLRRDTAKLADMAYELMCSQLLDAKECSLTLSWANRDCSVTSELAVDEREWEASGLLEGLSRDEAPE